MIGEDGHSRGGGPSMVAGGAAATRGAVRYSRAVCGMTGVGLVALGTMGDDWAT
jgi:hypothetical protein